MRIKIVPYVYQVVFDSTSHTHSYQLSKLKTKSSRNTICCSISVEEESLFMWEDHTTLFNDCCDLWTIVRLSLYRPHLNPCGATGNKKMKRKMRLQFSLKPKKWIYLPAHIHSRSRCVQRDEWETKSTTRKMSERTRKWGEGARMNMTPEPETTAVLYNQKTNWAELS